MKFLEVEDDEDEQSCSQSQLMEKSVVYNEALDHKERGEVPQIEASLNISLSSISSQEEGVCLLDSIGEKNDISAEAYKKGEVLNPKFLNEIVDISFEKIHESSFQSSFEDQFDNMQEELRFGQSCDDKQVIEYFEICHAFYDPIAEYMDKFFRWDSWLCICSKGHTFHRNLFPFCYYVLISIKHEEEAELLDKLLVWLH